VIRQVKYGILELLDAVCRYFECREEEQRGLVIGVVGVRLHVLTQLAVLLDRGLEECDEEAATFLDEQLECVAMVFVAIYIKYFMYKYVLTQV
jgi:hypothetical protein